MNNSAEGLRALNLLKKRKILQEELELKKRRIEEENRMGNIDSKFKAHYDAIEQQLKSDTIVERDILSAILILDNLRETGLVTLEDMKRKQEDMIKARQQQLARERKARLDAEQKKIEAKKQMTVKKQTLSFVDDEEEEEEEAVAEMEDDESKRKKRFGKNPDVDTSFLPDKEREEEDNRFREQLRVEWERTQAEIKAEPMLVVYSYWDGSGHRRELAVKKGNSIQQFLQATLVTLRTEGQFSELRSATVDQLMFVKEDTIIPHHYTFYDLIVSKARGKGGPLICFDVHDDVRLLHDAKREKDESHAGKVILRSWYERNKHIYPASRWEPYDPEKKYEKANNPEDEEHYSVI